MASFFRPSLPPAPRAIGACLWLVACACLGLFFADGALAQKPGDKGFVYGGGSTSKGRPPKRKDSGARLELEFGALLPDASLRAADSAGGSDLDWTGDGLDETPVHPSADLRFTFRTSDENSWGFSWHGMYLSAFPSTFPRNVQSGASTIPAGSDLNVEVQIQRLAFWWRRDWSVATVANGTSTLYSMLGVGYDFVTLDIDSDAFPVAQGRHRMSEMLPLPVLGAGWEQDWGTSLLRVEAKAMWLPEVNTMQSKGADDFKQESMAFEFGALYERSLNDSWALGLNLRYISMAHELTAGPATRKLDLSAPLVGVRLTLRF